MPIFTTNYDNVIELLAQIPEADIKEVITGFKGEEKAIPPNPAWQPEVFDQEPNRDNLFLFKLHGSISWRRDHHGVLREAGEGHFELANLWKENVLIPPGTAEFQYGEPWQSLRTYLDIYLQKASFCVAIGYRFDDITIRDYFTRSLERGIGLVLLNPEAENVKAEKFPNFDNVICIPETFQTGAEALREALKGTRYIPKSEVLISEPDLQPSEQLSPDEA